MDRPGNSENEHKIICEQITSKKITSARKKLERFEIHYPKIRKPSTRKF